MTRLAAVALLLSAGAVWAQSDPAPQAVRPPEKPATQQAEPADTLMIDSARPADRPEAVLPQQTQENAVPEPAQPSGPPRYQSLRESDFDYAACLLALHDLGTAYEEQATITDPDQRDCGIARPVRVTAILPGIALAGEPVMRCDTARALGFWLRDSVRPALGRLPGAPRLSGLNLGTGYDCRGRVGSGAGDKLSEHALGNAIDIASFTFHDREDIPVMPRQDSGDLIEAFQRAVRGSACLYFTTVLGPGSNAAHDDHLHLDLAARNGDWRLCQ